MRKSWTRRRLSLWCEWPERCYAVLAVYIGSTRLIDNMLIHCGRRIAVEVVGSQACSSRRQFGQNFGSVAFCLHFIPDFLDLAVSADQKCAAHDALERAAHEFLHPPDAVGFDHFVSGIAEQREIQLLLGFEVLAAPSPGSALTPRTTTSCFSNFGFTSRNSQASTVQPECWPWDKR